MLKQGISIVIPVYNEAKIIDNTITNILEVISSITSEYEIIIVNDGSKDDSKDKIMQWMDRNNNIKLINHSTNLGYGLTLIDGFKNAKKDLIFYTDADMPVDLNELKNLLPFMEDYDLAIGYRLNREDTLRRFIYSRIYNFLLRFMFKVMVKDANLSFKCMKSKVIQKCNLSAKSAFIDGQLLAEAKRNKFLVKEIAVRYLPRKHGVSNFDNLEAAVSAFKEIIVYLFRKR